MRVHLVVQRVHGRGGARGLERGGPHASNLRRIGLFRACSMLLHRRCARRRRTVASCTLRPSLSTRIFDAWPPIALSHTSGIDESTMRAEQGDRIAALAQHRREWMNRRVALQREHVRGRDGRHQQAPARLEGAYGSAKWQTAAHLRQRSSVLALPVDTAARTSVKFPGAGLRQLPPT